MYCFVFSHSASSSGPFDFCSSPGVSTLPTMMLFPKKSGLGRWRLPLLNAYCRGFSLLVPGISFVVDIPSSSFVSVFVSGCSVFIVLGCSHVVGFHLHLLLVAVMCFLLSAFSVLSFLPCVFALLLWPSVLITLLVFLAFCRLIGCCFSHCCCLFSGCWRFCWYCLDDGNARIRGWFLFSGLRILCAFSRVFGTAWFCCLVANISFGYYCCLRPACW